MTFEIGQIFEGEYPPEAADWCNENNAYIEEIEPVTKLVDEEFLLVEAEYDEMGELISEAQYDTKQVEARVRRFQIVAIPEPTEQELAEQALAQAKQERAEAVANIVVEVDGMLFDGDETSQTRMGRTIAAAIALGVDIQTYTQVWVLADNTVAQVTIAQLAQAPKLSGEAQTALWTVPYEG